MRTPEAEVRRLAEIALEYGVAIRATADGAVEIFALLAPANIAPAGEASVPRPSEPSQCAECGRPPDLKRPPQATIGVARAVRAGELLTYQQLAYELAVSRWTLWRAARSDLPDFPKPIKWGRSLYWRRSDIEAIEGAMMFFKGRVEFDKARRSRAD
jgi:predicted DNA-binding transcriptional regulator AlpA